MVGAKVDIGDICLQHLRQHPSRVVGTAQILVHDDEIALIGIFVGVAWSDRIEAGPLKDIGVQSRKAGLMLAVAAY
jgi:hypothetical protein